MTTNELKKLILLLKQRALASNNDTVIDDVSHDSFCFLMDCVVDVIKQEPIEVEATKLQKAYNKGYADGQRALTEHIKLCKEEQEVSK